MAIAIPEVNRKTPFDDLPQWLTVREGAAYLGVHYYTVMSGVHQGTIPHRRVGPKIIQIPRDYFHPDNATHPRPQEPKEPLPKPTQTTPLYGRRKSLTEKKIEDAITREAKKRKRVRSTVRAHIQSLVSTD